MLDHSLSLEFLTFEEYERTAKSIGGGHWSNYKDRWNYHRCAIDILRLFAHSDSSSILEMGTMGVQLVNKSDTIDYPGKWMNFDPTFKHDAKNTPWPIKDKSYDFFIALRVFHHLFPDQRECFIEAKRIAKNIIIVVPESYNVAGYENSKGIAEKQFIEWNGGVHPTFVAKLAKGMGSFFFWNSHALSAASPIQPKQADRPGSTAGTSRNSAGPPKISVPPTNAEDVGTYLKEAQRRTGIPPVGDVIRVTPVAGGKSGAKLDRVTTDKDESFVIKRLPRSAWWDTWVGSSCFEVELWRSGVMQTLPKPLSTPTLDAAFNAANGEWWLMMRDLSGKFLHHSNFDPERFNVMVKALARMHADNTDRDLGVDICPASRQFEIFTQPILALAGRKEPEGWLSVASRRADLLAAVPRLHDALGNQDFDFYLDMCDGKHGLLSKCLDFPHTFLHGDLQFQHIALHSAGSIHLIDWNFPVRGPATCDLTWCCFLNYWCFPANDAQQPSDFEPFKATYLAELGRAMGGRLDLAALERSWHLSWLKAFAQLGWCLVNPAESSSNMDSQRANKALKQAKMIADAYLG